ncbi:MAG: FHA domain-containing protein [Verrucomicrobiales bacterium]|nr:FHA domain-containing protein [Verrucomicrobiales bacterium]
MLKLAIEIDDSSRVEYEIAGEKTRIGRSHDNDFRIRNSYVSAFHAEVVKLPSGDYEIVDLGSFNGTFVNGSRIERSPIAPGDRISIGTLKGEVLGTGTNGSAPAAKSGRSGPVVAPLKAPTKSEKVSAAPSSNGSSAAKPSKSSNTGSVSSREAANLRTRLADAETERDRRDAELKAARESIAKLENDLAAQGKALAAATALAAAAKKASQATETDALRQLREERDALKTSETAWRQKAEAGQATAKRLATVEADLSDARAFILQEQQALADLKARLAEESGSRDSREKAETKLQSELVEVRAKLAKAQSEAKQSATRLEAATAETSRLGAEKAGLATELVDLRQRLADREAAARLAEKARAQDGATASEALAAAESDLATLRLKISALESEKKSRDEALATLEAALAEATAKQRALAESHERELDESERKVAQFHTRISELKLELESLSKERDQLRSEADSARKAQSKLSLAESKAARELAEARQDGATALNRLEELQHSHSRLEAEHRQTLADLAESRTRLSELEKQATDGNAELAATVAARDGSIAGLVAEMAALQDRFDQAESARDKAEAALAESRARVGELKSRLSGTESELAGKLAERDQTIAGHLGQIATLQAGLDEAHARTADVAAQLSEATRRAESAERARIEAAEALEQTRHAVADLESRLAALAAEREADHQTAASRIASLTDELSHARATLATLEAELERQNATLSGISGDHAATARRLSEVQAEWERATEGRRAAETALDEARSALATVEKERNRLHDDFQHLLAAAGDLDQIRTEKERLTADIAIERDALAGLREETAAAEAESRVVHRDLSERQDAASARLADIQGQIAKSSRRLEDLKSETREIESRTTENREALAATERDIETRRAELDRATAALREMERQRDTLGTDQARLATEADGLRSRVELFTARLANLAADIDSGQDLQARQADLDRQFAELQRREAELADREASGFAAPTFAGSVMDLGRQVEEKQAELAAAAAALDHKLYELKLAEDRIQLATDLATEIEARRRDLDALTTELSTTRAALAEAGESHRAEIDTLARLRDDRAAAAQGALDPVAHREEFRHLDELREKIAEYEDYQRILRESLRLDHATVQILSQQLIHKLDLIEDMISAYRGKGESQTVRQLEALRESFLDLLRENSVRTYSFDPGTELSIDHRRMIRIVETRQTGNTTGPTRIFATVRPGYVCADIDDGSEHILRKAEVITHG